MTDQDIFERAGITLTEQQQIEWEQLKIRFAALNLGSFLDFRDAIIRFLTASKVTTAQMVALNQKLQEIATLDQKGGHCERTKGIDSILADPVDPALDSQL